MIVPFVHFNGYAHASPGQRFATPPLALPVVTDEQGTVVDRGWAPGDEVAFDKTLAQQYGRVCDCHGDGTCWAYQHAAAYNAGFRSQEPPAFEVFLREVDPADATADEAEATAARQAIEEAAAAEIARHEQLAAEAAAQESPDEDAPPEPAPSDDGTTSAGEPAQE